MKNTSLKIARIKKNFTQKELARTINVSAKYISVLECTNILPSTPIMIKLSRILDEPMEVLFPQISEL